MDDLALRFLIGAVIAILVFAFFVQGLVSIFSNQDKNNYCLETGYELVGDWWEFQHCYKETESGAYEKVKFIKIGEQFKEEQS